MRDTLPFLVRLGLDSDADSRAIRRAYARELKQIDQAADPAGFQDLREAYEVALRWLEHKEWQQRQSQSNPEPTPLSPATAIEASPVAEKQQDSPASLSLDDAVFYNPQRAAAEAMEKFMANCHPLVAGKNLHNHDVWGQVLQHHLADNALLNITARTLFEAHIVHLLANGWQPGHETLFVVAARAFEWDTDRRRLHHFGYPGALLNRAIDEQQMFDAQESGAMVSEQHALIVALRQPAEPTDDELRNVARTVNAVLTRFPTWLGVISDFPKAQRLRERGRAVIAANKGTAFTVDEDGAPGCGV